MVEIKPEVLKWSIDTSGWRSEELAKKLKLSVNTLNGWLGGDLKPTIKQLENLSAAVKRPLAAFFLSEPPKEKPLPPDYRMLPNKKGQFDRKTVLAIRKARRLQKISQELSENLNAAVNFPFKKVGTDEAPNNLAERFREELKFSETIQKKLKTPYEAFNFLRDAIEDRNIIVFQISMPVEDARGFALVDESPALIVVNSKDAIEARIFTLMHEFGHVLLRESGVSMPEVVLGMKNVEKVEKWCNDFASAFLLPDPMAKNLFNENKEFLIETNILNKLSRSYKLSKAMMLFNMKKLNYISSSQYDAVLKRYSQQKPQTKEKKGGGFGATADKKCLSEKGQRFVSLVLNNVEKGFITHSDALNYLSIKSKSLEKVTSKAKR